MKKLMFFVVTNIILAPSIALAAGEAAEVRQMFQECINSGGRAASSYNAWVAQNGCICSGSSRGSGNRTCSGSPNTSTNTGSSGDLVTDSTRNVVKGMMNGNSQQTGIGLMGIGAAALMQSMLSNPAADARRDQQAAAAAEQQRQAEEQQRQAEEQRRAEELRQQEIAKQRILGQLKGAESSGDLALKTDSDSSLTVTESRGTFGSTAVVPVSAGTPSVGGLQLKLGDDAEKSSAQARQGFDTAGKMMGADLPSPPPVPASKPMPAKLEILKTLKANLKKNEAEEKTLKAQLVQLQQVPSPDEAAIKEVKQKIVVKEDEKKAIKNKLDLTANDPDDTEMSQPQDNPSAGSKK